MSTLVSRITDLVVAVRNKFNALTADIALRRIQDVNNYYAATDFIDNNAAQSIWQGIVIGSGGSANGVATQNRVSRHPGTITIRNGTAANSGYAFRTQIGNIMTSANMEMNFIFKLPSTTASGYNTNIIFRMGFFDSISTAESTDQIAFFKDAGSLDLYGRVVNNGSVVNTSALYTLVPETWYSLKLKIGSAGTSATFAIYDDDGNQLGTGTISSGLPIGGARSYGCGMFAIHTTETTGRDLVEPDFMDLYIPNLGRGVA